MKTIIDDDIDLSSPVTRSPSLPRTHPGEILREDIMPDMGLSAAQVAQDVGVPLSVFEEILAERYPVTAEIAVRLGAYFGNGAGVWLRLQTAHDLWRAEREVDTANIRPMKQAV